MKTIEQAAVGHGTPLYDFAESLLETSFDAYDYAKCVWLGDPDPAKRLSGEHPWPAREHAGEIFVYSVPIHAGFSAVRGTALFIGKDPWRDERDPRAWLVAEANFRTGEEYDHRVLAASVDSARQLWLQLAPANYDNIPKWHGGSAYNPPRYDQIRLEGRLTPEYYLAEVELRNGLRSHYSFEDIEVLESMTHLVEAVRQARDEDDFVQRRQQALQYEAGRRALLHHRLAA